MFKWKCKYKELLKQHEDLQKNINENKCAQYIGNLKQKAKNLS